MIRLQVVPSVTQCTGFVRYFRNSEGFMVHEEQHGLSCANAFEIHKCPTASCAYLSYRIPSKLGYKCVKCGYEFIYALSKALLSLSISYESVQSRAIFAVRREAKYGFHCTDIRETRVCPAALCGEMYTELLPYRSRSIDSAVESHLCLQVKRECD
jgi:hypothetical protein